MIYHCIHYTIDPHKAVEFETYARQWMNGIIRRCGGEPLGYFIPKSGYGGANNVAFAFIGFESLAAYEGYRSQLLADPEAQENFALAAESRCVLAEERSYFERIGGDGCP